MRINFNAIQPKNTIINAARVNASFAKNNSRTGKSAGTGRSDRADFSPQGKLMSMIENLTKQKQTIIDRKNELVENTMEKMSGFVEGTAEKMGGLVENTAEKVARTAERLSELTEDAAARVSGTLAQRAEGSRPAIQRDELNKSAVQDRKDKLAALSQRLVSITEKRHMLSTHMDFYQRGILKGNPTASSSRFAEALKELREIADRKNPDEHDAN